MQRAPKFVDLLNPLFGRLLRAGLPLGPNGLLTVRGRRSGVPRTTPVAIVERDGRRWVVGTFGEVNWVKNLEAAGEATLELHGHRLEVKASRLAGEEGARFFREVLGPYARRLPVVRPLLSVLGARDILVDPVAAAARRPVFELAEA
jgi:deazaflavin-dependent oxidoreductase (nitroreductase family)